MSGYSGTPLAKKLGIGAGSRVLVRGAPPSYRKLVAPLPAGVRLVRRADEATDIVHLFVTRRSALAQQLQQALAAMRPDAAIWVSWPKKASGVVTDLTEDAIRALALPLGLVDIKVCAVDETWSALKLVIRKANRAAASRP